MKNLKSLQEGKEQKSSSKKLAQYMQSKVQNLMYDLDEVIKELVSEGTDVNSIAYALMEMGYEQEEVQEIFQNISGENREQEEIQEDIYEDINENETEEMPDQATDQEMQMAKYGKESFRDWYKKLGGNTTYHKTPLPKAQFGQPLDMSGVRTGAHYNRIQNDLKNYPPTIGETASEYSKRLSLPQSQMTNNYSVWDGTKFVDYADFYSPSTQYKDKNLYNYMAQDFAQMSTPDNIMYSNTKNNLEGVDQMGEGDQEIKLADDPNQLNVGDEEWWYKHNPDMYKEVEKPPGNIATPIVAAAKIGNMFFNDEPGKPNLYKSADDLGYEANAFRGKYDVNTGKDFGGLLSPFVGMGYNQTYAQDGTETNQIPIQHIYKNKAQQRRVENFLNKNPEYQPYWEEKYPSYFDLDTAEKTTLADSGKQAYLYYNMPIKGDEEQLEGRYVFGNPVRKMKKEFKPYLDAFGGLDLNLIDSPIDAYKKGVKPTGIGLSDYNENLLLREAMMKDGLDPDEYLDPKTGRFTKPIFPQGPPAGFPADYMFGDPINEEGDVFNTYFKYYDNDRRYVPSREKLEGDMKIYEKNKKLYLDDKISENEFIEALEKQGITDASRYVPIKDNKKKKRGGQIKQAGGTTGDQKNYGLVTGRQNSTQDEEINTRHTLMKVPREQANLEAEGGETVLADLNNDGNFALYNIKGPRHSSGGVPLNLPEQSFVFSDFNKMKLTKDEMAAMGIESKKRMTPADVSKKFTTNEYYAAMKDPYADEIQGRSAEMMLNKNKMQLSKLAFIQEQKKNFEEGVPLTAFPFIQSQGQDPVEFMQQVENLNAQQAQQKIISQMPPEKQMQIAMLQDYMQQVDEQQEMQNEQMEMMPPPGMSDQQLAQMGFEIDSIPYEDYYVDYDIPKMQSAGEFSLLSDLGISPSRKNVPITDRPGPGQQPRIGGTALFDKAEQNLPSFLEAWKGVYGDAKLEELKEALKTPGDKRGKLKEVGEFQNWYDKEYLPKVALQFATEIMGERMGYMPEEFSTIDTNNQEVQDLAQEILDEMRSEHSFTTDPDVGSRQYDWKAGDFTTSLSPFVRKSSYVPPKKELDEPEEPKIEEPKPEDPVIPEPDDPIIDELEPGQLQAYRNITEPAFWLQDLLKINALQDRKRRKFYPWEAPVESLDVNWLLEDPTREIAATNEQLNIMGDAVGAFSGPQSLNARMSGAQGKAAANIANVLARVHNRNINTTNKGLALQTQYDMYLNNARRERAKRLYDNTQKTEQLALNEENFDREQMADLVANAYTNAANTYNLNMLYDYYNIDPRTGGFINMIDSRIFDKNRRPSKDPIEIRSQIAADYKKRTGLDATQEIIESIYKDYGYDNSDPLKRAREQYNENSGYNPMNIDAYNPTRFSYKKGGMKKPNKLLPFFVGTIGI